MGESKDANDKDAKIAKLEKQNALLTEQNKMLLSVAGRKF